MKKHLVGNILAGLQTVLSLVVIVLLFILDVLPVSLTVFGTIMLLALCGFSFFSQRIDALHVIGKILAVLLIVILAIGSYYLILTNRLLDNVTADNDQTDYIIAVVDKDDPAETIRDAADYQFGILGELDRDMVDEAIIEYNDMAGQELAITEYEGLRDLIDGFQNGEVQALIYNQSWEDPIDEIEEGFNETIKILETIEIETAMDELESALADVDVATDPFVTYISGIDQPGAMPTRGRSDVNMMAVVNPETRQILLVVTPRDYYVEFPGITGGQKDKLTHAGNFGVNASMTTMASIYDVQFNHHLRMNFTSFVDIVDALGGVTVYSEYAFTSRHGGYTFTEGYNAMDGEKALAFSRERYSLADGDFQRGKNQQAVMTAMIRKAMTPAILTGYADVINAVEGNIDMSFSKDDISSLVKLQVTDSSDWNIVSVAAEGTPASKPCYSLNSNASVVLPDDDSVAEIKMQIQNVMDGEIIDESIGTVY